MKSRNAGIVSLIPFILLLPLIAAIVLLSGCGSLNEAEPQGPPDEPEAEIPESRPSWAGDVPAPEFPAGLDWLNTEYPLTLGALRGKVVLLDFWTYGCINCIHNLPYLDRLAEEFADQLVIIGVHSAKFSNEGETESIRNIILRYELDHPVVNDRDFQVWGLWGVRAWPTLVLIDPAGNIVGGHAGEGFYETFRLVIASLVEEFADTIDPAPLQTQLEREGLPQTLLAFPGKVLADEKSRRLFIADTKNHRIVVAAMENGQAIQVVGSGESGYRDGDYAAARFSSPQGLALSGDGQTLYAADTGNHAIRRIDLQSKTVTTLAGTGRQAADYPPPGGEAPQVELSSPWDLALAGDDLYVAMAGSHQIWRIDLAEGTAAAHAGSGYEGWSDGELQSAELAQPSGLTFDGGERLYFADSEGSTVRFSDVSAEGVVGTIAGSGQSLFEFGDVDGRGTAVRFQHPLGIVHHRGTLYVADTYNHKVKRIDPETADVTTIGGSSRGWRDGSDPLFHEPGGISAAGGRLYVADTNNHAIRVIDLDSGDTSTLLVWGVDAVSGSADATYSGTTIRLESVVVAEGRGRISLDLDLPEGYKVTDLAPSTIRWEAQPEVAVFPGNADQHRRGLEFPLEISGVEWKGSGTVTLDLTLLYCEQLNEGLCFIERALLVIPVEVVGQTGRDQGGMNGQTLTIEHRVQPQESGMSLR